MKIKRIFSFLLLFSICNIFVSCLSSEDRVYKAVRNINSMCPIQVFLDETIEKVEYVKNEVIFIVTIDESKNQFPNLSYAELRSIESNKDMGLKAIKPYLLNDCVNVAFKNIDFTTAEELDLKFKFICKGDKSPDKEMIFKISWRDVFLSKDLNYFK